jgi:hypothetical protein
MEGMMNVAKSYIYCLMADPVIRIGFENAKFTFTSQQRAP